MIKNKKRSIKKLEDIINKGCRVVIYNHDNETLLKMLAKHIAFTGLDIEIWHCLGIDENYSFVKEISLEEMCEIIDMYRLYDFSDRVIVVSESQQYGSLFNYLECGILSLDEFVNALLD